MSYKFILSKILNKVYLFFFFLKQKAYKETIKSKKENSGKKIKTICEEVNENVINFVINLILMSRIIKRIKNMHYESFHRSFLACLIFS